jgi:micrococcal nuclease
MGYTMRKRVWIHKRQLFAFILIALIISGSTLWTLSGGDPNGEWVLVTEVVDGDTIYVGRGWRSTKVRLIGVDTPETVHPEKPVEFFGPESSEFTKKQLDGEKVRLESEPSNQYDDYGRLLAYVLLLDGTYFNAELIKQGYARVIAPSPFHRYEEFRSYEREARLKGLGLWAGKDICKEIFGNRRSKIYRIPGDAGCGRTKEENRVYFDTEDEAIKAGYRRAKR